MTYLVHDGHEKRELAKAIREIIGKALHTLQDFYSHSNWSHYNSVIHPTFGTASFKYLRPGDTCVDNSTGPDPLTSGYYVKNPYPDFAYKCTDARSDTCLYGEIITPKSYNAPHVANGPLIGIGGWHKCVHGHVCNGATGGVNLCLAEGQIVGTGKEGFIRTRVLEKTQKEVILWRSL